MVEVEQLLDQLDQLEVEQLLDQLDQVGKKENPPGRVGYFLHTGLVVDCEPCSAIIDESAVVQL